MWSNKNASGQSIEANLTKYQSTCDRGCDLGHSAGTCRNNLLISNQHCWWIISQTTCMAGTTMFLSLLHWIMSLRSPYIFHTSPNVLLARWPVKQSETLFKDIKLFVTKIYVLIIYFPIVLICKLKMQFWKDTNKTFFLFT